MAVRGCVLFVVLFIFCVLQGVHSKVNSKTLLRKKRYIAFPDGASYSAVVCLTSQMGITDGAAIFSEGINWGLVYDLPNDTIPLFTANKVLQKRRNRRDLYVKLEDIITSMGYNGRSCILRALCEAERRFQPKESSLAHHILNLIFSFPKERILRNEPDEHRMYHWASQIGSGTANNEDTYVEDQLEECSDIFQCPFSLIDLALGYYSSNLYDTFSNML
ncbi:uncharacterized protein LOC115879702 [Sitophilus oryzae]|uniref:Uncharacterized protein LOC115879702 n=1 Tax=Sitophilus oryzae TaxID=7048 RepID=A0A6J2XLW1_SITOR|nr:uncharacterized protein LOC115879702 [Sitophilus oryzae]